MKEKNKIKKEKNRKETGRPGILPVMIFAVSAVVLSLCFPVQAAVGIGPGYSVTKLTLGGYTVPESAEVAVFVKAGNEEKNATGVVSVYVKGNAGWYLKYDNIQANLGRGGTGKTKEGDEKTPLGMFTMNTPMGIKAKEEGFPENYLQVNKNHYWVGDSSSALYNKLVEVSVTMSGGKTVTADQFSVKDSEHIIDYAGYYDYAIDTGYNSACTKGLGSALFLHCKVGNNFTGGCIAVPEADMKNIMKLYKEGKTVIIIAH